MSRWLVLALGWLVLVPGWGAAAIEGEWQFVKDTPSGGGPGKGSSIVLSVQAKGRLLLSATKPRQVLTTTGTYTLTGERISIELPELERSVKNGPWRLAGDLLTLPFQLLVEKPGSSQWRRVPLVTGPIAVFYRKLDEETGGGKPLPQAAAAAAEAVKAQDPRVVGYEITDGVIWCVLDFKDGHREWVMLKSRPVRKPKPVKMGRGPLTADPRTHIPARPHTAPDDPPNKTAILFMPFVHAPYYYYDDEGGEGKVASLAEEGEDAKYLEERLRKAHYEVVRLEDEAATPKALYKAITECGGNPGVLYMSSHGGATRNSAGLMSGVCLGKEEDWMHELASPNLQAVLKSAVPEGYFDTTGHGSLDTEAVFNLTWMRSSPGVMLGFLAIMDGFFSRLVLTGKADFSKSLVYADACKTASNPALAKAFRAKAYLGHTGSAAAYVSPRLAQYLFSVLVRPTFSISEAMGLMHHVISKQTVVFFPEDERLSGLPMDEARLLVLTGSDLSTVNPPSFDSLYLCWMARWSSGHPEAGAQALLETYDKYWSKKHFSGLASPFATAGVRGKHVPTAEEVDEARHLVSGEPTRPYGRFTLNDADPKR